MIFPSDPNVITWRLHLRASPAAVYELLATDAGRARFWAEEAIERDGIINFVFPGVQRWRGPILARELGYRFRVVSYGGSITTFTLANDGIGGTDLTLEDAGVPIAHRAEVTAG